jgi:hypothetical protein
MCQDAVSKVAVCQDAVIRSVKNNELVTRADMQNMETKNPTLRVHIHTH